MLALAAILATAAPVVSPEPDRVALTLYRAPNRAEGPIALDALRGFGLVTETRTIYVPAGDSVLRFEGVADGIIPASAIVTGLPGGTIEKNRDAHLLSPLNLIDGSLGRQVTLRRTDRRTGKVRDERATIVAVPNESNGGVVLRTPEGIEAWHCAGLPEKLMFDGLPANLSAKPVLSVRTHSDAAARAIVTLTYLASGFDWNASYVATIGQDAGMLDLSGWATLANGNAETFPDASVKIVAGRLERKSDREILASAAELELHCFPGGTTTSDLPTIGRPALEDIAGDGKILLAGSDMVMPPPMVEAALMPPAQPAPPPPPENLGDLKLYRVPRPVTVASNAQKQVLLIAQPRVHFSRVYRFTLHPIWIVHDSPATILLRTENVEVSGLGIPLPSGTTTLYQDRAGGRLLLGLGTLHDTAKGEKVDIAAGLSPQVLATQKPIGSDGRRITIANANAFPVTVEVRIGDAGESDFTQASSKLQRIDGFQTWRLTLPAHQTADLDYSTKR